MFASILDKFYLAEMEICLILYALMKIEAAHIKTFKKKYFHQIEVRCCLQRMTKFVDFGSDIINVVISMNE